MQGYPVSALITLWWILFGSQHHLIGMRTFYFEFISHACASCCVLVLSQIIMNHFTGCRQPWRPSLWMKHLYGDTSTTNFWDMRWRMLSSNVSFPRDSVSLTSQSWTTPRCMLSRRSSSDHSVSFRYHCHTVISSHLLCRKWVWILTELFYSLRVLLELVRLWHLLPSCTTWSNRTTDRCWSVLHLTLRWTNLLRRFTKQDWRYIQYLVFVFIL